MSAGRLVGRVVQLVTAAACSACAATAPQPAPQPAKSAPPALTMTANPSASASDAAPVRNPDPGGAVVGGVSGRLPPEVIQRIVREHFELMRTCYEAGLARDENLTGRVIVRFVISRDGLVTSAQDGGSDLPDAQVRDCVIDAFTKLEFPKPEGGIVTVVYPILLAPE